MTVYFPQRRERRREASRLVCLSLIIFSYIVIYTYICFIEILFVLKSLRSRGKNFKKICYIGCLFVYLGMKLGTVIRTYQHDVRKRFKPTITDSAGNTTPFWVKTDLIYHNQIKHVDGEMVNLLYER